MFGYKWGSNKGMGATAFGFGEVEEEKKPAPKRETKKKETKKK